MLESLFNKVAGLKAETPTKVFSCENYEILRTTILKTPANGCFWSYRVFPQIIYKKLELPYGRYLQQRIVKSAPVYYR